MADPAPQGAVTTGQPGAAPAGAQPGAAAPAGPTAGVAYGTGVGAAGEIAISPELNEWAQAKGYKDFEALAKTNPTVYKLATSYRETEKFIGGDKIPLPKDMNDGEALKQVFGKLGMPADAKEYKLSVPPGQGDEFANSFRSAAHDANLTQQQAGKLNTWWNGMVDGLIKSDDAGRSERAAAEKIGLEKDWGGNYETNRELAARAQNLLSSELGIPRDKLTDGLEETFGLRDAMRILNFMGNKAQLTNDQFEGGGHGNERGGVQIMSIEDAKSEKNRLLNNREFAQDYRKGNSEARQKINQLNTIIASDAGPQQTKISNGPPARR